MDRSELEVMLGDLVADGTITDAERQEVLRLWDAGEITAADLPLSTREGLLGLNEWLALAAVLDILQRFNIIRQAQRVQALASVLRRAGEAMARQEGAAAVEQAAREAGERGRRRVAEALGGLPDSRRDRLARDMIGVFHEEAESRTSRYLLSGRYDDGMRRWHTAMRSAVRDDLLRMAQLAKGGPLDAQDLNRLGDAWVEQQGYMLRFAEEVAAKEVLGEPMSEAQIKQRMKMYAGHGYSEYWRTRSEEAGAGYVIVYRAVDDGGTCGDCLDAEMRGPYPAGTPHPVPGASTCQGRGHCRCHLELSYDPDRYEQLISEGVPA